MKLYSMFEEMYQNLKKEKIESRLMEFIDPLPEIDSKVNSVVSKMTSSGKVLLILGQPGTGKSSYIYSLTWKSHINVRNLQQLDCTLKMDETLSALFDEIQSYSKDAIEKGDKGPTAIVLNYLENLSEYEDRYIRSFFRKLNGLLRTTPLLIIWPVTEKEDVEKMLEYSKEVSKTLFDRETPSITFSGPSIDRYKNIIISTISVLNDGKDITSFGLTFDDFSEIENKIRSLPRRDQSIREFIELVKERQRINSMEISKVALNIPKVTEIWFVFGYPNAEDRISEFTRKSDVIDDNFTAIHDKFNEYAKRGQREAVWDAKRLSLALYGSFKTRILYMPTNCLISVIYSYTKNEELIKIVERNKIPQGWNDKYLAKKKLETTPLYKTLVDESMPYGKRRGGPSANAIEIAAPAFGDIAKWVSPGGSGSDKELNKCIAEALNECRGDGVTSDSKHPWLQNIFPDLFIDLPHKQICVEFHYTNQDQAHIIADYCLEKLDTYMTELVSYIKKKEY